ncbi:glycosyl hydrolase family 18 protein [Streptomyces sp. SM12]|uniref:glycosyl hydrolase family 18 protein n=2 Tax=Streptomyces TaxID=1883 RepID=UPI001CA5A8F3|nr:glycosyl hydrolase family 18 protein [Streptomyces sp. SM12]
MSKATHTRRATRRKLIAAAAALTIPIGGVVALSGTAQAAGDVTAEFSKGSSWDSGFNGQWTIHNGTDTALDGWTLEWEFPEGTEVTSLWNGALSQSGNSYTVTAEDWNGALQPGASLTVGFGASGTGEPAGCLINDNPCSGSGDPTDPDPTNPDPTNPDPTDPDPTNPDPTDPEQPTSPGDHVNLGYFTEWGTYDREYLVKNIVTSGSAEKLTHINYAFGDVRNGECVMGDSYAALERSYTAEESVSGEADAWDQPLRGNFNQLLQLKEEFPHIQVLWSFGGWTWSGGFGEAMEDPERFAQSCFDLVNDPQWEGVFDGIDLDWEYPNGCGLECDSSGPRIFGDMMSSFRDVFGDQLVTAAITADASEGGKIDAVDYAYGAENADYIAVMTYDFFGAFAPQGPTAPHSALTPYDGIPQEGFTSDEAIQKLVAQGVPREKLLLGIGFYGRGWTGVTQSEPGGSATGAAPGTYEAGIEDYKVLKEICPVTGFVGGTAYAHCGDDWWSYDTPETILTKMAYAKDQGLGGAFFWELHGDTADGELIAAMDEGLR